MTSTRTGFGVSIITLSILMSATSAALAKPPVCRQAIATAGAAFVKAKTKALGACEGKVLAGKLPPSTACATDPTTIAVITKAATKLHAVIGKACGGDDKMCGADTTNEDTVAGIGWPSQCPDFDDGRCAGALGDCADIAECVGCIAGRAVDQAIGIYYDDLDLDPARSKTVKKCQTTIGKAAAAFFGARTTILHKCWEARLKGQHSNLCPLPGGSKAPAAIAKAAEKMMAAICKGCGGADKACGGTGDLPISEIGFAPTCPAMGLSGGEDCGGLGPITTLDQLVACVECTSASRADCADRAQVLGLIDYPSVCGATGPVCGNGIRQAGEACDPPGSSGECPGATQCTDQCGCPTVITDTAGNATTVMQSGSSALAALGDLVPYGQYDVYVYPVGSERTAGSYLRLTADGSGTIPLTVLAYNVTEGSYAVEVEPVGDSALASRAPINLSFTAGDLGSARILPTNASGNLMTAFTIGSDVYVAASDLPAEQEVHLYVVDDQPLWQSGDPLLDRSGVAPGSPLSDPDLPRSSVELAGTPETVTTAGDGSVPPTLVWQATTGSGGAFDVIVDANRNGTFDPGIDAVSDHLTTGFVVQASSLTALSRGRAPDDAFIANLSVDRDCRLRDTFSPAEDVKVLINPPTRMQLGGDRWVKKYVVAHRTEWQQDDPLVDVSGANGSWEADTVQSGCTNEGCVLVWPAPLEPGEYDAVIDVNRNGRYDAGIDILDGGECPGFVVRDDVPARKRWTVMVYVDGDNDLEPFAIEDINEMEQVGSTDDVNVVVQIDRIAGHDSSNGDWTDTRRYYIRHDDDSATINSDRIVCPAGERNMADPAVLQDFVSWGAANYPADRYALVLWNHGRGFRTVLPERVSTITRDIIWDDTDGGSLDMPEIEQAISRSGVHLDLLGYDACLMAMAEVGYQMREVADVNVFSQDLEPGPGWPYDTILADLTASPTMDATDLSNAIVSRYGQAYSGGGGITQSSVASDGLGAVSAAVDGFAGAMLAGLGGSEPMLLVLRSAAQQFVSGSPAYDDYRDLGHFAQLVRDTFTGPEPEAEAMRIAAQSVVDALATAVLAETHSSDVAAAQGLTIWLPDCQFFDNHIRKYGQLRFARDTQWDEFLAGLCGVLFRIELTWDEAPSDLDSHLWDAGDPPQHLAYYRREIDSANLDRDDVSGFGPENVRLTLLDGPRGQYDYAVHHFAGFLPPSGSINVRVFRRSSVVPVASFTRSDWPISGGYWHVFSVVPGTEAIIARDTIGATPPVGLEDRSVREPKELPSEK